MEFEDYAKRINSIKKNRNFWAVTKGKRKTEDFW